MAEVKIIYTGRVGEIDRIAHPICSLMLPNGSYVDLPVFTQGYENADGVGDGEAYGKSIYATNVYGIGELPGLLPMKSATVKLAQFERAIAAAAKAEAEDAENEGITFEVEGYEEELYWNQIAGSVFQSGFYVKVGDAEYGENPNA